MTIAEVLNAAPGISRDTVYSWERQGWVKAHHVKRGTKQKGRDYPPEEVEKIRRMWELVQRGYSPRAAHSAAVVSRDEPVMRQMIRDIVSKIDGIVPKLRSLDDEVPAGLVNHVLLSLANRGLVFEKSEVKRPGSDLSSDAVERVSRLTREVCAEIVREEGQSSNTK